MDDLEYCTYCEKELLEEKGELAHGCLDCHCNVVVDKLVYANRKVEKLKELLLLTDPSVSGVIVGDTQLKQHQAFLDAFPDERRALDL